MIRFRIKKSCICYNTCSIRKLMGECYKSSIYSFEWTFINSQPKEEGLAKNDEYSTWDVKSVLTNTTGFSYSSVRSSALNKKIIKLKSLSQMSRHGGEQKHRTINTDMKETIYREPSSKLLASKIKIDF